MWLEPEGLDSHVMYPNGLSNSLEPEDQIELLRTVPGEPCRTIYMRTLCCLCTSPGVLNAATCVSGYYAAPVTWGLLLDGCLGICSWLETIHILRYIYGIWRQLLLTQHIRAVAHHSS